MAAGPTLGKEEAAFGLAVAKKSLFEQGTRMGRDFLGLRQGATRWLR
jgi:hypothetical protein